MTYTGPPEDRHSSTVEAAAKHERWRALENGEDDYRPTKAECDRDES
jgi:hypothetical protein